MKTGIELIAEERQEQIEKHCYDENHDSDSFHQHCELRDAAIFVLSLQDHYYPKKWNRGLFNNTGNKSYKERLVVAGALIAAEIDRIGD